MDGQALELEDDAFDAAGSEFGVMLFPDMPRGIREMARVTRPGGRVLMNVLGDPQKVEFFWFFVDALKRAAPGFTGPPTDPPPLPFQLRDPDRLRRELANAGLTDIQVETVSETLEFPSAQDMWTWLVNSNPVAETILAGITPEQREAAPGVLDGLLRECFGGYPAVLHNQVHIGVGTK
jgi:SAM-dependent methyltransferase